MKTLKAICIALSLFTACAFAQGAAPTTAQKLWAAHAMSGVWLFADGSGLVRIDYNENQFGITMGNDFIDDTRLVQVAQPTATFTFRQGNNSGQLSIRQESATTLTMIFPDGSSGSMTRVRPLTQEDRAFVTCRTYPPQEVEWLKANQGLKCL